MFWVITLFSTKINTTVTFYTVYTESMTAHKNLDGRDTRIEWTKMWLINTAVKGYPRLESAAILLLEEIKSSNESQSWKHSLCLLWHLKRPLVVHKVLHVMMIGILFVRQSSRAAWLMWLFGGRGKNYISHLVQQTPANPVCDKETLLRRAKCPSQQCLKTDLGEPKDYLQNDWLVWTLIESSLP